MASIGLILIGDLTAAQNKLKNLESQCVMLRERIAYIQSLRDKIKPDESIEESESKNYSDELVAPIITTNEYRDMTALQAVAAVLKSANGPLKAREIAMFAIGGGYGGANPDIDTVLPTFSAAISRNISSVKPVLRRVKKGRVALLNAEEEKQPNAT